MRVTNNMMISNMLSNMTKNLSRMDKLQKNLATGKKFTMPSDDPIGVSKSLRLNTDVAVMDQYKRNVEDCMSWLDTTEVAVSNISEVLKRAKELTVQAATETYSGDQRKAIAQEIEQLKGQLISIGNTNYAGSYIFSGYKTDKTLLDSTGKYDLGGAGAALTPPESINVNVGLGDSMGINFIGQKIFGVGADPDVFDPTAVADNGDTAQLIAVFDQLIADLKAAPDGDTAGINAALGRLETHYTNINAISAEIGVKTNRLELTLNRISDDTLNLKSLLSKNEDADISEVIMNLKMAETVYSSSLATGARIIQPSLIDFLN